MHQLSHLQMSSVFYLMVSALLTAPAWGQIERFPAVDDPGNASGGPWTTASYPHELSESLVPEEGYVFAPRRLSNQKPGVLQRVSLTGTWLDRSRLDDVGISELELYATFGVPMPTREAPLLITPGYEVRWLDGPIAPDFPARLHDAYLGIRWLHQLNDCWGIDLAVSPGVHTDLGHWDDDAFRITGHAVASVAWAPPLKVVLGVVYLDRDDVNLLPAAGLIWTPSGTSRYEVLFPRPKIAWRLVCGDCVEDWLYLAGEFGGGSWSIERTGGTQDVVTMRDYRAILGLERTRDGGGGSRIEVAWVFGRKVEFGSQSGDFAPDDTIMLRSGWAY